jgi:hypothetical protein
VPRSSPSARHGNELYHFHLRRVAAWATPFGPHSAAAAAAGGTIMSLSRTDMLTARLQAQLTDASSRALRAQLAMADREDAWPPPHSEGMATSS